MKYINETEKKSIFVNFCQSIGLSEKLVSQKGIMYLFIEYIFNGHIVADAHVLE